VSRAENLTTFMCRLSLNLGALTSWNPQGLSRPVMGLLSGFGGLQVTCWPLVPKFAGSHLAEDVGFLGQGNPQQAFLRRGSKAVGPMS